MVANYVDGKRRFGSYAREAKALSAAEMLAKRIDARAYVAASLTHEQAIEYADAVATLKRAGVSVRTA
jgi:imidazole glycerol phosphate synthase subunit HisF